MSLGLSKKLKLVFLEQAKPLNGSPAGNARKHSTTRAIQLIRGFERSIDDLEPLLNYYRRLQDDAIAYLLEHESFVPQNAAESAMRERLRTYLQRRRDMLT